jgi:hypothetical protein
MALPARRLFPYHTRRSAGFLNGDGDHRLKHAEPSTTAASSTAPACMGGPVYYYVIDDDNLVRASVTILLEAYGYQV